MSKYTLPNFKKIETKQKFRHRMLVYITKQKLLKSTTAPHNKVPDFEGSEEAIKRLSELQVFKNANLIEISLDNSLVEARNMALRANKEILLPRRRAQTGQFIRVTPSGENKIEGIIVKKQLIDINAIIKVKCILFNTGSHSCGTETWI